MSDWSIFADDDGKPLGRARRIQIAVKHTLLGRESLRLWTGGRIVCIADPEALPTVTKPWIGVAIVSQAWATIPNQSLVDTIGVSILPVYDEDREQVADTEPNVTSVIHEIDRALFGNYELRVAYFDNEPMVERIEDLTTVIYDNITQTPDVTAQQIAREVLYWYEVNAQTGEPVE